jgi:hypothetical protein
MISGKYVITYGDEEVFYLGPSISSLKQAIEVKNKTVNEKPHLPYFDNAKLYVEVTEYDD